MCRDMLMPNAKFMFRKDLKSLEAPKEEEGKAKAELSSAWLSVEAHPNPHHNTSTLVKG